MSASTKLNPPLNDMQIPKELRRRRQWVGWILEQNPGKEKPNKKPVNPLTGQGANTSDPETWGTFEDALRIKEEKGLAGVGFAFSPKDKISGVDLDGCVDPDTGEIDPWAWEVVQTLDSYTEFSPSRTGLHVLVKGSLRIKYKHPNGIGFYSGGGYMTITGEALFPGKGIERRQEELDKLYRKHFREKRGSAPPASVSTAPPSILDDEEIVALVRNSGVGAKFAALYDHGETSKYLKDDGTPGDRSRAHFGLLGYLTPHTRDPEQLERLIDASAFGECEKWRDNPKYRHRTISKAIAAARGKPLYRRRNAKASPEVQEMARRMDWLAANQPWEGRNGARNYRILRAFLDTGGEQGKAHPLGGFITSNSLPYLAYRASMTRPNSILAGVGDLEELGWLQVLKRGRDERTPNTYWVNVPAHLDIRYEQPPPVSKTLIHLRALLGKVRNNGAGTPGGCFKVRRRSGKRIVTYPVEYPPKPPLVKGSIAVRGALIVEKAILAGWRVAPEKLLRSIDPDASASKLRDFMRRDLPPIVDAGLLFLDPDTGEVCVPLGIEGELKKHLQETGCQLVSDLHAKALRRPDEAPSDSELEANREHTREVVELRRADDKAREEKREREKVGRSAKDVIREELDGGVVMWWPAIVNRARPLSETRLRQAARELGVEWHREKDGSVTAFLPQRAKEEVSA